MREKSRVSYCTSQVKKKEHRNLREKKKQEAKGKSHTVIMRRYRLYSKGFLMEADSG